MSNTRDLVLIAMFAGLTAVLAYVYLPIPMSPVPITGQTMGVMISGAILGAKKGFMSQVVYLLLGVIGLPVFAGGMGGISVLLGPTGGYLLSCPIAAFIVGYFVKKSEAKQGCRHWGLLLFGLFFGGVVAIYVPGVLQLSLITQIPIEAAILQGAVPYLIGDAAKVVGSTLVVRSFHAASIVERLSS